MIEAVLNDSAIYSGLSSSQVLKIKEDLTFDNPAYYATMKYSRYSTTRVPKHLEYFTSHRKGVIEVPLGYRPDFTPNKVTDMRIKREVKFPAFKLTLRDSQREAFNAYVLKGVTFGKQSVQLPTGKGKSILGIYTASRLKQRTLIVVHKLDLLTGWEKDIELCFGGKASVSVFQGKKRSIGEHFTIATIQTLARLSPEEFESFKTNFGFVIQDEMHHCPATTFSLVNKIPARYRLGLSATPERNDGLTHVMTLYFGDFCYKYAPPKDIEDDGDILPVDVILRDVPVYCCPVCKLEGNRVKLSNFEAPEGYILKDKEKRIKDLTQAQRNNLDRTNLSFQSYDSFVLNNSDYKVTVCNDIVSEYNLGHSCIAFFLLKEEIHDYYQYLRSLNIPEEDIVIISGDFSSKQNLSSMQKAESNRKLITLTTYAKSTEGTNVKQWEVAFLVSSLNNERSVEQAVGRVRRTFDNKIPRARVYDYSPTQVYGVSQHRYTRLSRYRKLRCNCGYPIGKEPKERPLFNRGFGI